MHFKVLFFPWHLFTPYILLNKKLVCTYIFLYIYYYILSGFLSRFGAKHLSTLTANTTLTQCWPTICDAGPASNQHWLNASCWELRSAGLVLLNTAGDDYKPTPTQCLLNVGPASPVLASIHSVLVSTSC